MCQGCKIEIPGVQKAADLPEFSISNLQKNFGDILIGNYFLIFLLNSLLRY